MGRVSKKQADENRQRVIAAASDLFRQKGVDRVGITELMKHAGLTHGGFYGQFQSKDQLAGEACAYAFDHAASMMTEPVDDEDENRFRMVSSYFEGRDICPMATLAHESALAEKGSGLRAAFTAGLSKFAGIVSRTGKDEKALSALAAMVGAAVLRRATDDLALADAIDAAVLRHAA